MAKPGAARNAAVIRRAREADCQAAIVDAATAAGWRVHAQRAAQTTKGWRTAVQGHAGFPDLVLCRRQDLWFVELKRSPNSIELAQHEWLGRLARATTPAPIDGPRWARAAAVLVVWVPEQQQAFIEQLISSRPDPTPFIYQAPGA